MIEHAFRFGVVAATAKTGADWAAIGRRAEELGFDALLIPDTVHTLAPMPALAAAAAATRTLHVGTYVLSAPNRSPGLVAWESQTLQLLSDGRFELGIGGGRPGAERDAAKLGADFGTRAREDELARTVSALREAAGSRFDELELHLNLAAVAESVDDLPEWLSRMVGGDPRAMAAAGGMAFLIGTPAQVADELRRRRDEFGISYIGVSGLFMEQFAPVIELLR